MQLSPTSTVAPGQPLPQLWLVLEPLCAGTTSDFAGVYRDEDLNTYPALATVPRLLPLLSRQLRKRVLGHMLLLSPGKLMVIISKVFSSVQSLSRVRLFATP